MLRSNYAGAVAIVALVGATTGDARLKSVAAPRCWTIPEVTAAKINELSIKLNVESLRCRTTDTTIQDQYDHFTQATKAPINSVAKTVKTHFRGSSKLYDDYAISVANKYGGGVAGESCAQVATLIQSGIATGSTVDGLSAVAEQANILPLLAGGACPLKPLKPFLAKRVAHHTTRRK